MTRSVPAPPARLPAEQRREQIIQIAIQLFSQRGFNGVTTREIATAAGITEAVIFKHFETKDQLYKAVIDSGLSPEEVLSFRQDLEQLMEQGDDEAVIRHLIRALICAHQQNPDFERLMAYAALERNEVALRHSRELVAGVVDLFRNYMSRRQEQGHLRPIGSEAALMAIAGMAKHYAINRYIYGALDLQLEDNDAVETFTQIALTGLRPPEKQTPKRRKQ